MPEIEVDDLMSGTDDELSGLGEELEGLGEEEILGAMAGKNLNKWLIEQPLPLGVAQDIGKGGVSKTFAADKPQKDMLISGLVISADTDATLEPLSVTDVRIGRDTQLQSAGNIPASCFRANSNRRVKFQIMRKIIGMEVDIKNTSAAVDAANVRVAAFGYLAEDVVKLARKAVNKYKGRRR